MFVETCRVRTTGLTDVLQYQFRCWRSVALALDGNPSRPPHLSLVSVSTLSSEFSDRSLDDGQMDWTEDLGV